MANITTSVPNLIQGVSQQSPTVRFPGQCEEQINALPSVTEGLTKRPPARLIKKLQDVAETGDFVHFINRSDTERYVVVLQNRTRGDNRGVLRAFNLATGNEATIQGVTGGYAYDSDYLVNTSTSDAHKNFKALTIGDSTFLLNTTKVVAEGSAVSDDIDKSKALAFIKQGDYVKKYGLTFRDFANTSSVGRASFSVTYNAVSRPAGPRPGYLEHGFEVASISVADGGQGYEDDDIPTLEWTSEFSERPLLDFTISGGAITGVSIVHAGFASQEPSGTITASEPGKNVFVTTYDSTVGTLKEAAADTTRIAKGLTLALQNAGDSSVDDFVQDSTATILGQPAAAYDATVASDYTFKDKEGSITIDRTDGRDFFLEVTDGLAGQGLGIVHKEVDSLSDLPVRAADGFRVAVRGDADNNEDDYYLRFETNDGQAFGEGGWVEEIGPNIKTSFDASTLPLQLINTGVDTFTLDVVGWGQRKAGDDTSNPFPSFVGKTLNNFVFFKNRLGFIFEDSLVLSEAGQLFNFFRTTVRTLLDTAPIDVATSVPKVTNLKTSVAFQESLLLFAERGQFVVQGDPVLSNKTISIQAVTNYDVETTQEPLALGSYVYFPFVRGDFLGLQEYSLNATTDVYDSADITNQVPAYVSKGDILTLTGSSSADLIALSPGGRTFYLYKYYFNGREKILSAWGKATLPMDVVGMEFFNSSLYVLATKGGQTYLTELKCEPLRTETDTTGGFTVHLDMLKRHQFAEAVTSLPASRSIDIGFDAEAADDVQVYDKNGNKVNVIAVSGSTAVINTDNEDCFSGVAYSMEYTFSEPVFRVGNPATASGLSRMILRNGTLFFSEATDFRVEVAPLARDTRVFTYSPNVINVTSTDSLIKKDGKLRFSIFTQAEDSVIKIINDGPFTSNFQSCEFEANVHTRANRI